MLSYLCSCWWQRREDESDSMICQPRYQFKAWTHPILRSSLPTGVLPTVSLWAESALLITIYGICQNQGTLFLTVMPISAVLQCLILPMQMLAHLCTAKLSCSFVIVHSPICHSQPLARKSVCQGYTNKFRYTVHAIYSCCMFCFTPPHR